MKYSLIKIYKGVNLEKIVQRGCCC